MADRASVASASAPAAKGRRARYTPPAKPDFIFDNIGHSGKWQVRILFLICIGKLPVGFHQLATVFLAPPIETECIDPPDSKLDICKDECKDFKYDREIFEETIIMEWDLVCDKKLWAGYGQTIFMLGILIGNVSFGVISDKKGRRLPLIITTIMQLISGPMAAISPWFWLFVFFRFVLAVAIGGMMLVSFCLVMEIIGPRKRELYNGILFHLPFNSGHILLPVVAYFIRHWRWYQLALSSYSLVLITFFCFIPESPRWLMVVGRIDESVAILEKAARVNKTNTEAIRPAVEAAYHAHAHIRSLKKGRLIDLLRTPRLRCTSLCIFYNWFVWGFGYFGVSQYVGVMSGNIFLNVVISALFGIPGVVMSMPLTRHLGRKPSLLIANVSICLAMGIFIFIPKKYEIVRIGLASFSMFGCGMHFTVTYMYTAECFPTIARNAGIGFASMMSRIAAMTASNVAGLKDVAEWLPPALYSVVAFFGAVLLIPLPETLGEHLAETIEEAENLGRRN